MNDRPGVPAELPFSPAAERNRGPILAVLKERLAPGSRVLEIGAGTGQHAVAFVRALPDVRWLATDRAESLGGLQARVRAENVPGLLPPMALDVGGPSWPDGPFDATFTANTCHIMPWAAVCAMLAGVSRVLRSGGECFVYGPFREAGAFRSAGDERFDRSLRRQDAQQGIRDLEALEREAARHHLVRTARIEMPANNLLVILRRPPGGVNGAAGTGSDEGARGGPSS